MSFRGFRFVQWDLFCRPEHQILLCCYHWFLRLSPYHGRTLQNGRLFCWCPQSGVPADFPENLFSIPCFEIFRIRYPAPLCAVGGRARASHHGVPRTRALRQSDLQHVSKACQMVAREICSSQRIPPKKYSEYCLHFATNKTHGMYPSFEPIIFRCPGCGCCISRQPPIALAVNVVHTRHDVVIVYIRSVAIHRDPMFICLRLSWVRSIESLELHESPLPVRNFLVTLPLCAPNLRTNEGVTLYVLVPVLVWEIERPSDGL